MASSIRTASPEEAERLPNHKLFSRQRMDPLMFFVRLFEWRVVVGASLVVGCLLPWYATMAAAAALLVAPLLRVGLKASGVRPPAILAHPEDVPVIHTRVTAKPPKDGLCVFLIGARHNPGVPFNLEEFKWLGEAVEGMLEELEGSDPEVTGFLGVERFHGAMYGSSHLLDVQYWRSQEHVVKYAQSQMNKHASAWRRLFALGKASPSTGFWHESYEVAAGGIDTIYVNMPLFGLGKALGVHPAVGSMMTSRNRVGKAKGNDWPAENDLSKQLY